MPTKKKQSTELATVEASDELSLQANNWASDGWDIAAQIVSLEEGDVIEGMLVGEGDPVDVKDESTGEMKQLGTWIFQNGAAKLAVLSSHQLDKELPSRVGKLVRVAKLAQKQVGSRRVNRFLIAHKEG